MRITLRCKRVFIAGFMINTCVGCDQITKLTARHYLSASTVLSYWGDFFRLQYVENTGAFLGFGSALPYRFRFWVLIVLIGCGLTGMLFFILIQRHLRFSSVIALALVIAGGLGNLIDRILNNGEVIDFMNLGIGNLQTGIFNVADLTIMAGAGILIFCNFRYGKKHNRLIDRERY